MTAKSLERRSAFMLACITAVLAIVLAIWFIDAVRAEPSSSLALRCEGTKITTERKEPDEIKRLFPKQSVGEEDKGTKDGRNEERASTDVIVTDQLVYAFGTEFETGFTDGAFVRFGRTVNNSELTGFVIEGFFGKINRFAGTLEAEQLKYKKNGWLYLKIEYSLNCSKMERKF